MMQFSSFTFTKRGFVSPYITTYSSFKIVFDLNSSVKLSPGAPFKTIPFKFATPFIAEFLLTPKTETCSF